MPSVSGNTSAPHSTGSMATVCGLIRGYWSETVYCMGEPQPASTRSNINRPAIFFVILLIRRRRHVSGLYDDSLEPAGDYYIPAGDLLRYPLRKTLAISVYFCR